MRHESTYVVIKQQMQCSCFWGFGPQSSTAKRKYMEIVNNICSSTRMKARSREYLVIEHLMMSFFSRGNRTQLDTTHTHTHTRTEHSQTFTHTYIKSHTSQRNISDTYVRTLKHGEKERTNGNTLDWNTTQTHQQADQKLATRILLYA